ncbi:HSP20 family protein [Methylohalomonas lacus]|uniref:HSP20 family protein n=1 Tax=Methylohalomonas lacus TaxID=398773 RepID=A0AAE3L4B1_9GAMM|nr:Hsp20/alpha crystallin family protein [Methylohalomonas lacus]MCS3903593.1 HSP20 family protein [Methylohalomonas lacus]
MAIMHYEPWSLLRQIQSELNNNLNQFDSSGVENADNSNVVTSHWRPAVDIREEKDRFVIVADLPGVDPKDIEVTMENGVLALRGERKFEKDVSGDNYKRVERAYGTFYRRFSLPDSADPDRIEAQGRNGVLEIVLPKQEKVQPRRIDVKS